MAQIVYGDRIAERGVIVVGCTSVVFDGTGERILLTRRSDNGRWCLPGGRMEPGESAAEACVRELYEETGLQGAVRRLIGIYTDPNRMSTYPDGNRYHVVTLCFEVTIVGGTVGLSDETTEVGYYDAAAIETMDLMENYHERIADARAAQVAAFVR